METLIKYILWLVFAAAMLLLVSWPVMLLLGSLAIETGWPCAVGFPSAVTITVLGYLLTSDKSVTFS